jgi:hypothetical protein
MADTEWSTTKNFTSSTLDTGCSAYERIRQLENIPLGQDKFWDSVKIRLVIILTQWKVEYKMNITQQDYEKYIIHSGRNPFSRHNL